MRARGPVGTLEVGQGNREELAKLFQVSWLPWAGLFLLLAGAAWLILRIRARFRDRDDPTEGADRMLMQMGELHRQGGLSDEEYRSIRSKLSGPMDHSLRRGTSER
jgi:LPXTG-motif cell wall-anchored protein